MMVDETKLQRYLKKGFSANLILLSIASQKSPDTILDNVKKLRKFAN